MGIHLLKWIVRGLLVIKLSRCAECNTFLTPAPRTVVSDLEDHIVLHSKQCKGVVKITYRLLKQYGESVSAHFELSICTK